MIDYKAYETKCRNYSLILEALAAVAIFVAIGLVFFQLKWRDGNGQLDCQKCHSRDAYKRDKLTEYFKKNGSRTPEEMANAVLKTRSPRLMAAIAVRETGGNPSTRATGYKKRHHGAFQVNPKHWGQVSHDPVKQALQSEAILTELTAEKGSIVKGLNAYGGDKSKKVYAENILKELQEVPR